MSEDRDNSLVRRYRLRAGLTQEKLAERSGLSVRTIRGLESGRQRNPQLGSLRQLAAALSLDSDEYDELVAGLDVLPPAADEPAVPRQLPAAPAVFTGRDEELAAIEDSTATITAIAGPGGIGKTWLALRWAHQHLDRFPDGQLFVDLRGFSPDSEPVAPLTVVRGFLGALGVDAGRLGGDLEEHTALYRSQVAGKRMLIVLDNAATAEQVVPLLPGTDTCTVLVTSRRILTALLQRYTVNHLSLSVFGESEFYDALTRRLGDKRLAAEPEAVAELVELCGRYPLALAVVAGRAHARPDIPLTEFAAELRESGLDGFDDGDDAASLPAVVSWSVRSLTAEQHEVFGLLGIAPGCDISLPAAASLTGLSLPKVRKVLRELEEASLLIRRPGGRHTMHDIIRNCAVAAAHHHIAEEQRDAALRRVLDFYVQTARSADRLLAPHRPQDPPVPPVPGCRPQPLADYSAALAWFDTEHANLLAAQDLAIVRGWRDAIWQLAWNVAVFHFRRGFRREDLTMWEAAERAAADIADPGTRVRILRRLGVAYAAVGRHTEALDVSRQGLALAEGRNVFAEQGFVHYQLSWVWAEHGDDRMALDHIKQALDVFVALGLRVWMAAAHAHVGECLARLGEYETARYHCQEALRLDDEGTPDTVSCCRFNLGYIAHHTGQLHEAVRQYRQALPLLDSLGQTERLASTLDQLGHTYLALDQPDDARAAWREALALYQQMGRTARVDDMRRQLGPGDR
ncbi:ATP-binding protein [Kutzneria sp. NPDC052558]|uniref:ATP-binding protein n=1 Tax=Kutzneria sp. NPDC052558 TaxID=3364121 RepID=UPI0037CBB3CE